MTDKVALFINEEPFTVPAHTTVAAALLIAGVPCRSSVLGEPRSALCAMGICFECRVRINGVPHQRGCLVVCQPAMDVRTR